MADLIGGLAVRERSDCKGYNEGIDAAYECLRARVRILRGKG